MRLPKCHEIPSKFWYPKDANEQELCVYRLTINANSVCSDDFLSKYELDKKNGKDTIRFAEEDMYYGLSTIEQLEDAKKLLSKVKAKSLNLHGISLGSTVDGMVRKTPTREIKSHVTWWPYQDTKPETYYHIVFGGSEDE